jgi:hypothetical protein
MNHPPAIPTNKQMTANTYACTLVHCSLELDLALALEVDAARFVSVIVQCSFASLSH